MSVLCCIPGCEHRVTVTRRMRARGGPWACEAHQYAGETLLRRLQRLAEVRVHCCGELTDEGLRLVDRGIAATFRDCIELGREEDASKVMHGLMVQLAAGGGA